MCWFHQILYVLFERKRSTVQLKNSSFFLFRRLENNGSSICWLYTHILNHIKKLLMCLEGWCVHVLFNLFFYEVFGDMFETIEQFIFKSFCILKIKIYSFFLDQTFYVKTIEKTDQRSSQSAANNIVRSYFIFKNILYLRRNCKFWFSACEMAW